MQNPNQLHLSSRQGLRRAMDTIARGIGTSPVPYIKNQMFFPPDIVDDTQEYLDDTYVEALESVRPATEDMVSEDPEYEDDGF